MTTCFCFDIDGVLADHGHRKHLVAGFEKDWTAYDAAATLDEPIAAMVAVARSLAAHHAIVYVTGRGENCRAATLAWLQQHGLPAGPLYMRTDGEGAGADVSKARVIARALKDGWRPLAAFDDRADVLAAWQEEGVLACLISPAKRRPPRLVRPASRGRTRVRTAVRV
jgi:hypothetical protein